jgi:MFS transporter, PHS family, inorganic phosphate transporter
MLGYLYGHNRTLNVNQDLGVKVATPIGNLFGQLLFGWLADVLGRKRMCMFFPRPSRFPRSYSYLWASDGVELMIIIVATFGQAISGESATVSILGAIITWRFIMGVGIGGDYPLSAVISSEFAATRSRGRLMTAVFAFQGWGNLGSSIFYIFTLLYLKRETCSCCPCLAYSCSIVQEQNHP